MTEPKSYKPAGARRIGALALLLTLLSSLGLSGAPAVPATPAAPAPSQPPLAKPALPADKSKLRLFLLMGQSNMVGHGALEEADRLPHARVLVFRPDGSWDQAVEPLHTLDKHPGTGPGLAFGKLMAEHDTNHFIGLVPCAVGASPLKRWERGGDLYSNALARARAAMAQGTLAGMLWHQGEQDSMTQTNSSTYHGRLVKMLGEFRTDLGQPHLPIVVGQIGEFLYTRKHQQTPFAPIINDALARIPAEVPFSACAPSRGLTALSDEVHFDAASAREMGRRFALQMQTLLETVAAR